MGNSQFPKKRLKGCVDYPCKSIENRYKRRIPQLIKYDIWKSFVELSNIIGQLMKENRLLARVNHFAGSACLYKSSQDALYARFMDLLFVHHRWERSVAFYASKMCITSKYLTAVVKAVSGKTPTKWIQEETIKEIERMLCHTRMPIKEIVYRLNFPNASFFGKYFKQYVGVSPKEYRNKQIRQLPS